MRFWRISSIQDLQNWVYNKFPGFSNEQVEHVANKLAALAKDCGNRWGDDWSNFFEMGVDKIQCFEWAEELGPSDPYERTNS